MERSGAPFALVLSTYRRPMGRVGASRRDASSLIYQGLMIQHPLRTPPARANSIPEFIPPIQLYTEYLYADYSSLPSLTPDTYYF